MSPESDGGIDKQEVLAAITGAPASPAASPPRPSDRPSSAARRAIPLPPGPSMWVHHRSEIAAIISAFVGILWLSVGLARGMWGPSVIGMIFGIAALSIWALEVWNND